MNFGLKRDEDVAGSAMDVDNELWTTTRDNDVAGWALVQIRLLTVSPHNTRDNDVAEGSLAQRRLLTKNYDI